MCCQIPYVWELEERGVHVTPAPDQGEGRCHREGQVHHEVSMDNYIFTLDTVKHL